MTSPEQPNRRLTAVPPMAGAPMTADHRTQPRKQLKQFLTVLDASTQQVLGRMVDISQIGMMLIGSMPLDVHQEYLVHIQLLAGGSLHLRATCIWSRSGTTNVAHHGSGFRFESVTADQLAAINKLILAEKPA